MTAQFVVENAGCESCGALVRKTLSEIGTVEAVVIDENADVATVRLEGPTLSVEDVDRLLERASGGSGHRYRVRSGSWVVGRGV
ncbi:MAG TPA: heavy-metal-associated domain-containing protein [Gaiellaceae bacterium]|nr:heavy-metal-associated domain-containing protein [Gaiellaceae bacterium]